MQQPEVQAQDGQEGKGQKEGSSPGEQQVELGKDVQQADQRKPKEIGGDEQQTKQASE